MLRRRRLRRSAIPRPNDGLMTDADIPTKTASFLEGQANQKSKVFARCSTYISRRRQL